MLKRGDTRLSIDLIPFVPVIGATQVQLFQLVTKTLLEQRPVGWVQLLNRFLKRDAMLPDDMMMRMDDEEAGKVHQVGLKIFNWVSDLSWILMPRHEMAIDRDVQLAKESIQVLRQLKALKELVVQDVPAFTMKKISHNQVAIKLQETKKVILYQALFHSTLKHPELMRVFTDIIDYPKWNKANEIPIRQSWIESFEL